MSEEKKKLKPNKFKGEKKATKQTKSRKAADLVDDRPIWVQFGINLQQETFCQYYTSQSEFFGNGVQSYMQAYDMDITSQNAYQVAKTSASRLLNDVHICKRINSLLEEGGLNDVNVDKQLMFLINQYDDKNIKLGALREYNKLKQRITEKYDINVFTPVTKIVINAPKDEEEPELEHGNTNELSTRGETDETN